jgi:nitroreductase
MSRAQPISRGLRLTLTLPPEPEFGQPMTIEAENADVLRFLALRRSASAATLRAPGPDEEELAKLLRLAVRVPDHGKLFPWRFIILRDELKVAYVRALEPLAADQPNPEKATAALAKVRNPPVSVCVVSRLLEATIPEWEQRLSSGAVCMTLLIAAQAAGYGANWITDWYAYDARATAVLGLTGDERVAGFVHIGAPAETPLERVRPVVADLTRAWSP